MQLATKGANYDTAISPFVHNLAHAVLNIVLTMIGICPIAFAVRTLVHKEQESFFFGDFCHAVKVKLFTINRIILYAPVARAKNIARWCANNNR